MTTFAAGRRVSHYAEFIKAIQHRIAELDVGYGSIEAIAGLQPGYLAKVISGNACKRMGQFTMFLIIQALALDVLLVENTLALDHLKARMKKRGIGGVRPSLGRLNGNVAHPRKIYPDHMSIIGRKGNTARFHALSPWMRKHLARKAAKIRWARERAARQEA